MIKALARGFLLSLIIILPGFVSGQNFFRIKADVTIKEQNLDSTFNLVKGTVYYDKNFKKLVHELTFPYASTMVVHDSTFYKFQGGKLISTQKTLAVNEYSIYHLSLNRTLSNYGLPEKLFKVLKVEKEGNKIYTTYQAIDKLKAYFGKIVLEQENKKLTGIAFFAPDGKIIFKQFFKQYIVVKGLEFPTEVVQVSYSGGKEFYKITTYKNIVVNEPANVKIYNYLLPRTTTQ